MGFLSKKLILIMTVFIVSLVFSYIIFIYNQTIDVYVSFLFVLMLVGLFIYIYKNNDLEKNNYLSFALSIIVAIHSAILIAFLIVHPSNKILWPVDAYTMHLPGATNISNFIHGTASIRETKGLFDKIYFTQIIVGIFFSVFGINPVTSGFVLMLIKLATTIFIYLLAKKMFFQKIANLAAIIYVMMPTIIFYTVSFYKEAFIQLIIVVFSFSIYCVAIENRKNYLWLVATSLIFMLNERFYLFPMLLVSVIIYFFLTKSFSSIFKISVTVCCAICFFCFGFVYLKYREAETGSHIILRIFNLLKHFRAAYNAYPDVNPINMKLPYLLSFIKLAFTPYITLEKFRTFGYLSYFLIWGSIPNQIVIALSIIGIYKSLKTKFLENLYILLPAFLFLVLFAYISPYNGRLRDSFYPIIAIYGSFGLVYFQQFLKEKGFLIKDNNN